LGYCFLLFCFLNTLGEMTAANRGISRPRFLLLTQTRAVWVIVFRWFVFLKLLGAKTAAVRHWAPALPPLNPNSRSLGYFFVV
jgi:hypothetical protein